MRFIYKVYTDIIITKKIFHRLLKLKLYETCKNGIKFNDMKKTHLKKIRFSLFQGVVFSYSQFFPT